MGFLDKKDEPVYSPVPDDRSSSSSDSLLYNGDEPKLGSARSRTSIKKKALIGVGGFLVLLAYSSLLITVTSMWWKKERLHGANVIDCMSLLP